jgi:ribosomal protein L37AE/L43A
MPKVKRVVTSEDKEYGYNFVCPACKRAHMIRTQNIEGENKAIWNFNGDVSNPTFTPSLKLSYPANEDMKAFCCHSIITNGKITFCNDCSHAFAGKTVDMDEVN